MGQARIKRSLSQRLLSEHKFCCFCGGEALATSVDHVPAKIVFWGKRRPAGLEVPACNACNHGTRKLDQAAGLFARLQVAETPISQQDEFSEIAKRVSRDFPGWHREMGPSAAQLDDFRRRFPGLRDAVPGNIGPLSEDAVYTLGAKLGFALHYHIAGQIVPCEGFVNVHFDTNGSIPESGLPPELMKVLGPLATLKQGQWTTDGHFAYRSAVTDDGAGGVYLAHLGRAFLTVSFVVCDGRDPPVSRHARAFRPGDLQHADATAIARYSRP